MIASKEDSTIEQPLILFDGVCNLCNASVQFVINRDPDGFFRFASLQSETGKQILKEFDLPQERLYSIILLQDGKVFDRSGAALRIARNLNGFWPALFILIVVPPFIRNYIYDWVSRNRYKWFGTRDECMIPTPDLKTRFI